MAPCTWTAGLAAVSPRTRVPVKSTRTVEAIPATAGTAAPFALARATNRSWSKGGTDVHDQLPEAGIAGVGVDRTMRSTTS
jgi:hypothetical protein